MLNGCQGESLEMGRAESIRKKHRWEHKSRHQTLIWFQTVILNFHIAGTSTIKKIRLFSCNYTCRRQQTSDRNICELVFKLLYLHVLLHLYIFHAQHIQSSINYFQFYFSYVRHVSVSNSHHQVFCLRQEYIKCVQCSLIYKSANMMFCLIYLMHTRYLFALINFTLFLI
jgi:hypothetical protein